MDLSINTESFADEDLTWLAAQHGTDATRPITIDGSAFTGTWADGIVPSGVALGIITATGLYAPYTAAATHGAGSDVMAGHLFTKKKVIKHGATHDVGAALLRHGQVIEANLPDDHGVDAAGKADVAGRIDYV